MPKTRKKKEKKFKTRHDVVGKVELCKRLMFAHTTKCFMYKPETISENETHRIL